MSDECNVEGDGYEEEKGKIRLTYSFSSYCKMGRDG